MHAKPRGQLGQGSAELGDENLPNGGSAIPGRLEEEEAKLGGADDSLGAALCAQLAQDGVDDS